MFSSIFRKAFPLPGVEKSRQYHGSRNSNTLDRTCTAEDQDHGSRNPSTHGRFRNRIDWNDMSVIHPSSKVSNVFVVEKQSNDKSVVQPSSKVSTREALRTRRKPPPSYANSCCSDEKTDDSTYDCLGMDEEEEEDGNDWGNTIQLNDHIDEERSKL